MIPQREYFDKSIANSDNTDGYYIIEQGDFVYNPRKSNDAPYGPVSIYKYPERGIVSPLYLCFRALKPVNSSFYDYFFKSPSWHRYIYLSGDSGARHDRVSIKDDVFFAMPVSIPSEEEQLKISSFLSLLEQRIEDQQRLVEDLKKYKRGVMYEIFETKTLFSSHHYSLVQLGNECRFFSGGTPQSGNSKYYGGSIPFIRSGEVHKNTTELTLTEEGLNNSSAKMVEVGDLIMALYGATSGEVDISKISGAINQAILCIRPNTINRQYLKFLFECKKEDILKTYLQGGQGNLSAEIIKKLCFEIPLPSEQQESVDFLVTLENKISLEDSKLEQLLKIQNGLLQQLFT